jgi:hypothetical protein
MFWDHVDTATYLCWLRTAGMVPMWHRLIPEGNSGHSLVLARAVQPAGPQPAGGDSTIHGT